MNEAMQAQSHPAKPESRSVTALAQAMQTSVGHFDELRAAVSGSNPRLAPNAPEATASPAGMTNIWRQFFATLDADSAADMDQRAANLARQVRDNGITYNVYADESGTKR